MPSSLLQVQRQLILAQRDIFLVSLVDCMVLIDTSNQYQV